MLTVIVWASAGAAHAKKVEIETKAAPAAVQSTLARTVGDNVPKKLEKEKEDGTVFYTGKYKVDGRKRSVRVAENGAVLRVQISVGESDLPAAVRKAINTRYANAEIKDCKAVHLKGASEAAFFKVELGGKLNNTKLKLRPNGELHH